MSEHELALRGPLEYPGGKDGMYEVRCLEGDYTSPPGDKPDSRGMWEAAIAHQAARRGEEPLARNELVMRIAEARSRARYRDVEPDAPTE